MDFATISTTQVNLSYAASFNSTTGGFWNGGAPPSGTVTVAAAGSSTCGWQANDTAMSGPAFSNCQELSIGFHADWSQQVVTPGTTFTITITAASTPVGIEQVRLADCATCGPPINNSYTGYLSVDHVGYGSTQWQYAPGGSGPSPSETIGGCNQSESMPYKSVRYPVNTATGEFWHRFDDLSIPGRGLALDLTRTYSSSLADQDGPFGFGFTDSYAMSLTVGSSNVTVNQECGSTLTFMVGGSGCSGTSFVAPPRVLASLCSNSDGTYTLTRHDQSQYTFSTAGQLTQERDRNGYITSLAYNGSNQLTTVTDPSNRMLTFAYWAGTNHVETVTDSAGRSYRYSYSNSDGSGNLTSVTAPMVQPTDATAPTTSLAYTDPNDTHRLTTLKDPVCSASPACPGIVNVYDSQGRVVSQSDALGRKTTFSYASGSACQFTSGNCTTITDPAGDMTVDNYFNNELVSEYLGTQPDSMSQTSSWAFAYDPGTMRMTSSTDPNGNVTTYSYDALGNRLSQGLIVSGQTRQTQWLDYNSFSEPQIEWAPAPTSGTAAVATLLSYDSSGNVTRQVRQAQATSLSSAGAITAGSSYTALQIAPLPNSVSANQTLDLASGANFQSLIASAAAGQGATSISVQSFQANASYPAGATVVTQGQVVSYCYDGPSSACRVSGNAGDLVQTTDPRGDVWKQTYDAYGDVATMADPSGNKTQYLYYPDNIGRLQCVIAPLASTLTSCPSGAQAHVTLYASDSYGDISSTTDGLDDATSVLYNLDRSPTYVTDANGNVTSRTYDVAGELTEIDSGCTSPAPSINCQYRPYQTTTYDAAGRVYQQLDGLSKMLTDVNTTANSQTVTSSGTEFASSDVGRAVVIAGAGTSGSDLITKIQGYSSPNSVTIATAAVVSVSSAATTIGATVYQYDGEGRQTAVTDPDGLQTKYTYDPAGNVASVQYPGQPTTGYCYDAANELIAISFSDTAGCVAPTVTYSYFTDGLRASMTDGTGTSSYAYDSLGRLSSATDGANDTVGYGYAYLDTDLTSLTYPQGTVSRVYDLSDRLISVSDWLGHTNTFAYDADSNLCAVKYGNGVVGSRAYDGADRIENGTNPAMAYYSSGSINGCAVTSTGSTLLALTYTRDAMGQVTGENTASPNDTYDASERLSSSSVGSYTVDAADHLTTLALPNGVVASQQFDSAGEVTMATLSPGRSYSYSYSQNGQPTEDRTGRTDQVGGISTYGYDQLNRLTSFVATRSNTWFPARPTTYTYNGDGLRVAKAIDGLRSGEVWDLAEGLPLMIEDGATAYLTGPGGLPVEQISAGSAEYYQPDQLGSTRILTDGSAGELATYTYDPYGNAIAESGNAANPFLFAGQYMDAETGFYYLRARYYDPTTAQFTAVDPMSSLTGTRYGYGADNPLTLTDPTGRCPSTPLSKADCDSITVLLSATSIGLNILSAGLSLAADGADGTIVGIPAGVALQIASWGAEGGATAIDWEQGQQSGHPDWVALGLDVLGFAPVFGAGFSGAKVLWRGGKLIEAITELARSDNSLLKALDKASNRGGLAEGVRAYLADCLGIGPRLLDG